MQTFHIKCTLNGYIRCNMSAEFQRVLEQALTQLDVKILFDNFTYDDDDDNDDDDDDDDDEADTMMDVVYEVDSDDD